MRETPLPPLGSVFSVANADLDTLFDFVDETAEAMGIE